MQRIRRHASPLALLMAALVLGGCSSHRLMAWHPENTPTGEDTFYIPDLRYGDHVEVALWDDTRIDGDFQRIEGHEMVLRDGRTTRRADLRHAMEVTRVDTDGARTVLAVLGAAALAFFGLLLAFVASLPSS